MKLASFKFLEKEKMFAKPVIYKLPQQSFFSIKFEFLSKKNQQKS